MRTTSDSAIEIPSAQLATSTRISVIDEHSCVIECGWLRSCMRVVPAGVQPIPSVDLPSMTQ